MMVLFALRTVNVRKAGMYHVTIYDSGVVIKQCVELTLANILNIIFIEHVVNFFPRYLLYIIYLFLYFIYIYLPEFVLTDHTLFVFLT